MKREDRQDASPKREVIEDMIQEFISNSNSPFRSDRNRGFDSSSPKDPFASKIAKVNNMNKNSSFEQKSVVTSGSSRSKIILEHQDQD